MILFKRAYGWWVGGGVVVGKMGGCMVEGIGVCFGLGGIIYKISLRTSDCKVR
jgi:hypothetical protein